MSVVNVQVIAEEVLGVVAWVVLFAVLALVIWAIFGDYFEWIWRRR